MSKKIMLASMLAAIVASAGLSTLVTAATSAQVVGTTSVEGDDDKDKKGSHSGE